MINISDSIACSGNGDSYDIEIFCLYPAILFRLQDGMSLIP